MKPYPFKDQPAPNRIFNYRLTRARRIVENVFGITANRFRVLRKYITVNIVLAICVLHNFLMSTQGSQSSYLQPGLLDTESTDTHEVQCGMWREEGMSSTNLLQLQRRPRPSSQNSTRNELKRIFHDSPRGNQLAIQTNLIAQLKYIYFLSSKLSATPLWLNSQNVIYNKVFIVFFMHFISALFQLIHTFP